MQASEKRIDVIVNKDFLFTFNEGSPNYREILNILGLGVEKKTSIEAISSLKLTLKSSSIYPA